MKLFVPLYALFVLTMGIAQADDCTLKLKIEDGGGRYDIISSTLRTGTYDVSNWQECFGRAIQESRKWAFRNHKRGGYPMYVKWRYGAWEDQWWLENGLVNRYTPGDYPATGDERVYP